MWKATKVASREVVAHTSREAFVSVLLHNVEFLSIIISEYEVRPGFGDVNGGLRGLQYEQLFQLGNPTR